MFSSVDGRCEATGTTPPCSRPDGRTQQNLCDLAGNVWEWVADTFHATYDGHPGVFAYDFLGFRVAR